MKLKKLDPHSKEVLDAVSEHIRSMTPEEAWAFLTYRTPGIEETDMTGMFSEKPAPKPAVRRKSRSASA